jgi:hypothetical protein
MNKEIKIFLVQIIIIFIIVFIILPHLDDEEVLLISDPVQAQLNSGANKRIIYEGKNKTVDIDKITQYKISAVVKSKRYYFFDAASEVSPVDLVLVWGKLDTKEINENIRYSQSGRWYYYRYDCKNFMDGEYISKHSANVHIIPKNKEILMKLMQVHKEDFVTLEGYLVKVHFSEGEWKSSLSRNDTGNGACEIMYVESVSIN